MIQGGGAFWELPWFLLKREVGWLGIDSVE